MKKLIATISLLLAAVLALTACGGGSPSGTATTAAQAAETTAAQTTASAQATAEATTAAAEPGGAEEGFDADHNWLGPVTELTIFGVEAGGDFDERKDLPIPKELEKKTGVRLTWSQGTNEKWALMQSAGDLTDIVRVGASDAKTTSALIQSGYIYDFDSLLEQWGPNLMANMGKQLEVSKAVHGGMYLIPTNTGPGAMLYYPMLKWIPYRDAGYPEIRDMDTLIEAFVKMTEVMPVTPEGKKVYAFSSFIDWGNTFPFFYPWASALGYDSVGGWSWADQETMELVHQLSDDSRSVYWWTVELMYRLNKLGLFDPDTFTQTWEEMLEKRKAQQVLFAHGFWDRPALFNEDEELLDTYFPVRWEGAGVQGGAFNYLYEMGFVISSKCKNPEAAVRLYDYCASFEGAELILNGIEGEDWNLVNGVPLPTDAIIEARKAGTDLGKTRGIGYGGYNFLVGISGLTVDPRYDAYVDFTYAPEVQRLAYNELDNEIIKYFSADYINDIIYDAIASGKQHDMSKYDALVPKQIPTPPTDITRISTDIQQLAAAEWAPNLVYAKSDAEFQSLKEEAIAAFNEAGLAEMNQWYATNWEEAKVKAAAFN